MDVPPVIVMTSFHIASLDFFTYLERRAQRLSTELTLSDQESGKLDMSWLKLDGESYAYG